MVSSLGASKCLVTNVSTPAPTSAAGRTTVTSVPGLVRGERRARSSISSRSPTTLPSRSAASGAVSGSGTGLSGLAPYTIALVTRITRLTRPAAAAVSTVCTPRTLNARRALRSDSGARSRSVCTSTSTSASRPASAGSRTSTTRQVTPVASPRWSSIAITRLTRADAASLTASAWPSPRAAPVMATTGPFPLALP